MLHLISAISEKIVRNPQKSKWLTLLCSLASAAVLAISAAPAAADPPTQFRTSEQCNYVPAPTDLLFCFSQSGQIIRNGSEGGSTLFLANFITRSTVYEGPTNEGGLFSQTTTTLHQSSLVKDGELAVFHFRQIIKTRNSTTACTFTTHSVVVDGEVRHLVIQDVSCR